MLNYKILGNTSITLIAFSLGNRVLFECLKELASINRFLIHDTVMLGGAAPLKIREWEIARQAVSGRMSNVYCKTDKIL